ncbi:TetR family transcriptional regulator [Actinoplanes sp. TRM 88003]|uniref:TetR family transcriptional regulator n=1 Tax=Paractinoplanes aksuensis TaxID=2939490 RepID=A0ABT1DGP3_9ACTN|nr:TetR family transcriptional regulator [Actinoplanes aksuensis]MCO8269230.1 TetR family transcriptional regulator [Actinoplanes aksuensis]
MTSNTRARSAEAKQQRERAILDAARALATARSVREVTLTDVAAEVGLHKSAMLRYFETREQIFLALAVECWADWTEGVRSSWESGPPEEVLARSFVSRPLFCDLLAHIPLNLERNVSFESVRVYKRASLAAVRAVAGDLSRREELSEQQAYDVVATAAGLAGALWQMAAPGTQLREFYKSEPELAHAVVDVEPRLVRTLGALIAGFRSPTASR